MATTHRNQYIEYTTWTTWDNKKASSWSWKPEPELRREMPWLPVSTGRKTLDEMEQVIDWYLDPARADEYETTQQATAAWVAEGRAKGYNND